MNYWIAPDVIDYNPDLNRIASKVCIANRIVLADLLGSNREQKCVDARKMFCHMAHKMYNYTSLDVARYLNKDHSTVLYSCKQHSNLVDTDRNYLNKFLKV